MKTSDFEYDLPPELIAQVPAEERTLARMMVVDRHSGAIAQARVRDLPQWLRAGDLLVLNDTRVIQARIHGQKADTGGRVELLLLEETAPGEWDALCGASRRPRVGTSLRLADGALTARVTEWGDGGRMRVAIKSERPLLDVLEERGLPPLPPYIRRQKTEGRGRKEADRRAYDREGYQTVYARAPGAVAAPTAGLHFTRELLAELESRGVAHVMVTLHVGLGTFKPVSADEIERHTMESERFSVSAETANRINATRAGGGRVVAVGSTVVRALETVADERGHVKAQEGRAGMFIHPPYAFRVVDALLTNFHLPRSTLIMMVCAFAGRDLVMRAYAEAIRERYRFYSYGDCMLIR